MTIIDLASAWMGADVSIGMDTMIYLSTQSRKNTVVGGDCRIGSDSILADVSMGDGVEVRRVHVVSAEIGDRANIGPFAYLRPDTRLGPKTKVSGFCETKNIEVGRGAKIPHLFYVGDATIGEATNIRAVTIFTDYDGVNGHHSTVGLYYHTGTDSVFTIPVHIGNGVYTGGGTIVRHDILAGALAVNQSDTRIIPGWMVERHPDTDAARIVTEKIGAVGTSSLEAESTVESLAPDSNSKDK